jgi:hypothetical protein
VANIGARFACLAVPPPFDPLALTVPGMGELKTIRDFALEGLNACNEARAFLQTLQPLLGALAMPLCILGCVSAIMDIFDPNGFPPVDPTAIPAAIDACGCLIDFTPFGFCSTIYGLLNAIILLLQCIIGLMADIIALEARIAAVLAGGGDLAEDIAECLAGQADNLLGTITTAFGPVADLFNSTSFLFNFVGVPFQEIQELSGDTAADVVVVCQDILIVLEGIRDVVNSVCPG